MVKIDPRSWMVWLRSYTELLLLIWDMGVHSFIHKNNVTPTSLCRFIYLLTLCCQYNSCFQSNYILPWRKLGKLWGSWSSVKFYLLLSAPGFWRILEKLWGSWSCQNFLYFCPHPEFANTTKFFLLGLYICFPF